MTQLPLDEVNEIVEEVTAIIQTERIYADPGFKPHWVEDLEDEDYHAINTAVGSSGLRLMLKSPDAFHWGFFGGNFTEPTPSMKFGKLVHLAVLEGPKFEKRYVVMPEFTGFTGKGELTTNSNCKEVKEKRKAWIDEQDPQAIITTQDERDKIVGIIGKIIKHKDSGMLFGDGKPEMSGFYVDPETGIMCKFRNDFMSNNGRILTDLKTAKSSEFRLFGSNAFRMRYDIQLFMYATGVKQITGHFPDILALMAVEPTGNYESAIYTFEVSDLLKAESDYRRALRRIKHCIDTNDWPQRQEEAQRIYTPKWFIDETVEIEEVESE